MVSLESIQDGIDGIIGEGKEFLGSPGGAAIGGAVAGGAIVGTAIAGAVALAGKTSSSTRKKRKKAARITHTKRGWKQDRARRSKQKWEVAYRKRKAKRKNFRKSGISSKRLHYTKKGQPYIILSSGKARFVKKNRR